MRIITEGLEPQWIDTGEGEYLASPLSTSEYMRAVNLMSEDQSYAVELCQNKISDWRGIEDADGKPIKFDSKLIDRLPPVEVAKLTGLIIANSKFTEIDRKN